jgi:hypothetical protein
MEEFPPGLWNNVLAVTNALYCQSKEELAFRQLGLLLEAFETKQLASDLHPSGEPLGDTLDALYAKALADNSDARLLLVQILALSGKHVESTATQE